MRSKTLLKVQQVLKYVKSPPLMWTRIVLPAHWSKIEYKKAACSFRMFERSCLRQRRLFTFDHHYASHEVICGMLAKVYRDRINYLKLLCFLHYPLTVWSHIFTGCSQGGKVIFGNTLCSFNIFRQVSTGRNIPGIERESKKYSWNYISWPGPSASVLYPPLNWVEIHWSIQFVWIGELFRHLF